MSRILVVREADEFSRILAANGYEIIKLPLIETKVLKDLSDFEKKLAEINNYDGIFLTSKQSAKVFVEQLRKKGFDFTGNCFVLGKRSYEILKSGNLKIIFNETANTVQEFLESLSPEELKNKRFLFIRGEKSLRTVPEFLEKNAEVDEIIVYETLEIAVNLDKIKELQSQFVQNEIATACFFSPSQAESFIKQFGAEVLHQTKIAAIGKTTAGFFERQNIKVDFISPKATAEDFAVKLIKYLEEK